MAQDFSEYKMSNAEIYRASRANTPFLCLDFFNNTASFPREKGLMMLSVDRGNEYFSTFDAVEEDERIQTNGYPKHAAVDDEDAEELERMRLEGLEQNEKDLAFFANRFLIDRTGLDAEREHFHQTHPKEKEQPLNNVLSGAKITLPIGEGILDFVYADFEPTFQKTKRAMALFWRLTPTDADKMSKQATELSVYQQPNALAADASQRSGQSACAGEQIRILRKTQLDVRQYFKYTRSACFLNDLTYSSLYTAICPPVLSDDRSGYTGLCRYYAYLRMLQNEYLLLLEFCFDDSFHPEILGALRPEERFYLFQGVYHYRLPFERQERISFHPSWFLKGKEYDAQSLNEEIYREGLPRENDPSLQQFAEEFGISPENLNVLLRFHVFMVPEYEFHTVADVLALEFSKMLESGTRIRKCRRCGKYFLMKGNYDTQYCSRIAPGETRKCNELAAKENYKRKAESNLALNVYSKYYRRYSARLKVNQIKEDEFKKWRYAAIMKRNECTDGKITIEELIDWMEAYFPNRQKKK